MNEVVKETDRVYMWGSVCFVFVIGWLVLLTLMTIA